MDHVQELVRTGHLAMEEPLERMAAYKSVVEHPEEETH